MAQRPTGPRVHSPLTLDDLTQDLVWPKLLRAGHLALRPSRLGMAMVFVVGLFLLGSFGNRVDGDHTTNVLQSTVIKVYLDVQVMLKGATADPENAGPGARVGSAMFAIFASTPAYLARTAPWVFFLVLPLMGAWTAIWGGAISRSAACEFSQGVSVEWPQALRFSLLRWKGMIGALLGPPVIAWGIMLGMAAVGGLLFTWPAVNLLSVVLWPLFLIGGLVAAVMLAAYLVGWPLLLPSVACEGTDGVDAIQHAYSFVFARPLRLVVYLLILFVQMLLVGAVVAAVFWLAVEIAQRCGMEWSGARGLDALGRLPGHVKEASPKDSGWPAVRWVVTGWTIVPLLVPVAFVVSFVWSGSTILYLAMRKVVDGQDVHEIWMPGMVEGTMASEGGSGKAEVGSPNVPAEGVSDDGPADEG
jgi:hypothetical protein